MFSAGEGHETVQRGLSLQGLRMERDGDTKVTNILQRNMERGFCPNVTHICASPINITYPTHNSHPTNNTKSLIC